MIYDSLSSVKRERRYFEECYSFGSKFCSRSRSQWESELFGCITFFKTSCFMLRKPHRFGEQIINQFCIDDPFKG